MSNGFKVGPNYAAPAALVANDWIDASDKRPRKDADDLSDWWKVFNDPFLDELITTANQQNLTLRQAGLRILQARAQYGIAVGELFPQSQFASGSYKRIAAGGETSAAGAAAAQARFFDQWNLGLTMAWEIDFWGRFRRAVESAGASLDASVDDYNDVRVTLLSDIATNYVQMRTFEQRIDYARQNVKIQEDAYKLIKVRVPADAKGELVLNQALALLKQTEAAIPELEISLRQATNRLCVLLGIPPEDLDKKLNPTAPAGVVVGIPADLWRRIPTAEMDLSVGIPADLLRRRPDVRRAERQAAAQSAQIGIAEAEFYPHITLSGTLNYSADSFKNVFRSSALNGNFGPSFQWKVLNYGRNLNNIRLQDARFQELIANYQSKVLVAQQEVEDGMVTFQKAKQRARLQEESVKAGQAAERIGWARWVTGGLGLADYTTVTLIQQNLVQQQDNLAQAKGEISQGLIQVYRAVGGGWQTRNPACEPSARPQLSDDAPAPAPAAQFGRPF